METIIKAIRLDRRLSLFIAALLALLVCSPGRAASLAIAPDSSGSIAKYTTIYSCFPSGSCSGSINLYYQADELSVWVESGGCNISCWPDSYQYYAQNRSYLVFDLSAVGSAYTSASLEIDFGYAGRSIHLFGLESPVANELGNLSPASSSSQLNSAFNDIISGPEIVDSGEKFSNPTAGVNSVALSASALDTINSSTGLYAIGIVTWDFQAEINSATLVLDDSVSAVPLPAAAWLFGSALLGLGVVRRRSQR